MATNLNITAQTDVSANYSAFPSLIPEVIFNEIGLGFHGGCYAPNKKVYFVPRGPKPYVLVYDTVKDEFYTIPGVTPVTSNQWAGAVIAENEKIYCIPHNASFVLIIDTKNDTLDLTSITGLGGFAKWEGGCLYKGNKIYCCPLQSGSAAIIDTTNDTIDTSSLTGITGWYSTIHFAENGMLYCIPARFATNVIIINPKNNTYDGVTISGLPIIDNGFRGSVYAKNNKIYCSPFSQTFVLIIDTTNNTADTTSITGLAGGSKWYSGSNGQDGYVYFCNFLSTTIEVIDVDLDAIINSIPRAVADTVRGFVADENGFLYSCGRDYVTKMKTEMPKIPNKWVVSAYVNKF